MNESTASCFSANIKIIKISKHQKYEIKPVQHIYTYKLVKSTTLLCAVINETDNLLVVYIKVNNY